jgi:hypothetical protein
MDPERALFEAALGRITRLTIGLAAAGCLLLLARKGWTWAVAYLLGATASCLNFLWLKRLADALGARAAARPSPLFVVFIGLRYLLLAAGAYAIVNFTPLNLPAALVGLFVPVAAVIAEIIFELIYASS